MECYFLHAPHHLYRSIEITESHTFLSSGGIIYTIPRKGRVLARRSGGTESVNGSRKKELTKGWESEFLGEVENSKKVKEDKPWWFQDTQEMDWCYRARHKALKSIEERGLNRAVASFMEKKKKKKANVKSKSTGKIKMKKVKDDSESDTGDEINVSIKQGVDSGSVGTTIQPPLLDMGNVYRLSNRGEEFTFNKRIVRAKTAEEVFSVICGALLAVGKGTCPSCLSPLNISTAIHRIAKCMEESEMIEIHRLEFARRRETAILVSLAMISLPETSVQGVSNIAWALSKIGGPLIYVSEMDRVAEVAITMVPSFESQHVANISGAFAAMKHSVPMLFAELSKRAIDIIHTFREREICQLLWSFAYLSATVEPLLECLDHTFSDKNQVRSYIKDDTLTPDEEEDGSSNVEGKPDAPVLRFSQYELGNLAWSYAVFGEMRRVFFGLVWGGLTRLGESMLSDDSLKDISFASQILLVNQSLKVEFQSYHPPLFNEFMEKIALVSKNKKFSPRRTSVFQRDVGRLLFDTAFNWVKEHDLHCYSLDAALVDQKVAVEVDGPTHFSRNSGIPLGNTILKRRFIAACGWKLIYISHQEWDALKDEKERIRYLNGLLKGLKGIKLLPTARNTSKNNS